MFYQCHLSLRQRKMPCATSINSSLASLIPIIEQARPVGRSRAGARFRAFYKLRSQGRISPCLAEAWEDQALYVELRKFHASELVREKFPDLSADFVSLQGNAFSHIVVGGRGAYPLIFETAHVNPYSGKVEWTRRVCDRSALELVTESMRPLHTGDFAGLWLKLVYFLFGDHTGWNRVPIEERENMIGRHKLSDIEQPDAVKKPYAHNVMTNIEEDGQQLQIVRDNMPFGEVGKGEFATYFVAMRARQAASSACSTICLWATRQVPAIGCWISVGQ
jgi:hypothetical protein